MSIIRVEQVTRIFDRSQAAWLRKLTGAQLDQLIALNNVSLEIEAGQTYALVGESGSGKSTLARIVVGLDRATQGQVFLNEQPFDPRVMLQRRQVQMVFQSPYASLNPRWRVKDILAEPLKAFGLRDTPASRNQRVDELLEQVGLSSSDGEAYPHEFSGGQRQRISIARALASEPKFLVCDEPTSALDVSVQAQVLNLLKQLQRELGLTYLFITHDLAVVRSVAHKIGVLRRGELVEEGAADQVFADPRHEYTQILLSAAPVID